MRKYIFTLISILMLMCSSGSKADTALPGQWRVHNTYDEYFNTTIDTPDRVYLVAYGQQLVDHPSWNEPTGQLFVLDKATGELEAYNAGNYLNGNTISTVAYNAAKRYLLIVYSDYNIDILYDDDTVCSIPALASATLNTTKNVRSVTFSPQYNSAYLATDFGYLILDDVKYVISESRIYNQPVNGMARIGDTMVIATENGVFSSPVSDRHTTLESFKPVEGLVGNVLYVLPLTSSTFGVVSNSNLYIGTCSETGSVSLKQILSNGFQQYVENGNGYFLWRDNSVFQLFKDGSLERVSMPADRQGFSCGSWNMRDFYIALPKKGLEKQVRNQSTGSWTTSDLFLPNAPRPFSVFYFDYSPDYGMLAGNETYNRTHNKDNLRYKALVSGYNRGLWIAYGDSEDVLAPYLFEGSGPVVDPLFPDYIWLGTRRSGLFRIDMRDNSMEMFSHPAHAAKGLKGFHAVFPTSSWDILCNVTPPTFDSEGNLWAIFNPSHAEGNSPVYCWKAADRKSGNVSAFKSIPVRGYGKHYDNFTALALKAESNRRIILFGPTWHWGAPFYLFYHGGTIDDTSDDRLYSYDRFVDQDGTAISYIYINTFYEDVSTGYVWVGTDTGLFYFRPSEALAAGDTGGTLQVRRVKVARNDGTNLADYLLDGSDVTAIKSDGAGRKWFGTLGNGVLVTSSDGSRMIEHFTTENSRLPSDNIYSLGFDPTGNAVWIGNAHQTATYYCDATPSASDYSNVLAFPNPVRPEYSGDVTIQGLMENSLVKVVDASGGIVKELGLSNGGMSVWDLTDLNGRPVSTGVYYILSSTSGESTPSSGNSTKILVVR